MNIRTVCLCYQMCIVMYLCICIHYQSNVVSYSLINYWTRAQCWFTSVISRCDHPIDHVVVFGQSNALDITKWSHSWMMKWKYSMSDDTLLFVLISCIPGPRYGWVNFIKWSSSPHSISGKSSRLWPSALTSLGWGILKEMLAKVRIYVTLYTRNTTYRTLSVSLI